jgi:hypothetical protein
VLQRKAARLTRLRARGREGHTVCAAAQSCATEVLAQGEGSRGAHAVCAAAQSCATEVLAQGEGSRGAGARGATLGGAHGCATAGTAVRVAKKRDLSWSLTRRPWPFTFCEPRHDDGQVEVCGSTKRGHLAAAHMKPPPAGSCPREADMPPPVDVRDRGQHRGAAQIEHARSTSGRHCGAAVHSGTQCTLICQMWRPRATCLW